MLVVSFFQQRGQPLVFGEMHHELGRQICAPLLPLLLVRLQHALELVDPLLQGVASRPVLAVCCSRRFDKRSRSADISASCTAQLVAALLPFLFIDLQRELEFVDPLSQAVAGRLVFEVALGQRGRQLKARGRMFGELCRQVIRSLLPILFGGLQGALELVDPLL